MDKETRNTLRNTVTQCRRILEEAVGERLEGQYGIHASGKVEAEAHMGHLSQEDADYRGQLLVHVGHIQAGGYTSKEAVAQLVREVAFTHLNRLVAYKMMERRELIREAVSRGIKSSGFLFYLADHPEDERLWSGGQPEIAYRHFLEWLGRTFAEEIRSLFAPHDPANPLFPPPRALDEVLARLNAPELADIWNEDETIGWVYQYFTPDELRREARAASSAPRNSYELAFRNQFYTPRYVVEFLSDNTLGRIWYEMRQGDTRLTEQCRYLVHRPHELFLAEGEEAPGDNDQSEIVYVPYRRKKDPRQLKILDPAGGSGHFLLYCFDLLVTIYEEAYDDPQLGPRLQADYPTLADLRRALPGLILRHNLHLIDIDRRATQIAALALWLRAQRAYQTWEIPADRRPPIRKANIVCAEPMPGDKKLLAEFMAGLNPPLLGQLVETVFEKMTLAGEAGSLLKIEVELREAIAAAKQEWEATPKAKQLTLFAAEPQPEQLGFDLSGISDAEFWDKAEGLVLQALADYVVQVTNGKGLARQLFAEDTVQGFVFMDMAQQQFDAILMNPPFGSASQISDSYVLSNYPLSNRNLYAAFVLHGLDLLNEGFLGCISDRTFLVQTTFEQFRNDVLLPDKGANLNLLVDLGWGVLDAQVQTAAYTIRKSQYVRLAKTVFLQADSQSPETRENDIVQAIRDLNLEVANNHTYLRDIRMFRSLPKSILCFWLPEQVIKHFYQSPLLSPNYADGRTGLGSGDNDQFYSLIWEVPRELLGFTSSWVRLSNGGGFSPYYRDHQWVLFWKNDGEAIKNKIRAKGDSLSRTIRSRNLYGQPGLTFGKRTENFSVQLMPMEHIFTDEGHSLFLDNISDAWWLLAVLNTTFVADLLNSIAGMHKTSGYVARIPIPNDIDGHTKIEMSKLARLAYDEIRQFSTGIPENSLFVAPIIFGTDTRTFAAVERNLAEIDGTVSEIIRRIDELFLECYGLSNHINRNYKPRRFNAINCLLNLNSTQSLMPALTHDLASYCLGACVGRWDVRNATGERQSSALPEPFAPLPMCSPGMLQNNSGLPATETPSDYPIEIDWDGILVDDPDHPDDIVRHVQQVLSIIWVERAAAIEQEACAILGVKELRGYFRKAGKGGFWDDHVKRYSKSRRKAPIYWLLQSSKGSYGLWLYYHRLDKDIYYKALINYVEPKLRLEENKLSHLQAQRATFGTGGSEAKQLEKQLAQQEALLTELRDFHDKLRAVAHLNLTPDLNDGVILNIAPLRELVPWKEAQAMWEELQAGKYDWSSVSQQLLRN